MRNKNAGFSLPELIAVVVIVSLIAAFAIPAYNDYVKVANVSKIVNYLGTFKTELVDDYIATGSWPVVLSGIVAAETTPWDYANLGLTSNFRYNYEDNKVWVGAQLSSSYGSGWIFILIVANDDDSFDTHCGSLDGSCVLGYCNSLSFYPTQCSEQDLAATFSIE